MNTTLTKKDQLFLNWKDEEVHTSKWFENHGISKQLTHQYISSGLLHKLGGGAYIRANDKLNWYSAIYTIQNELNFPIHIGAKSALDLNGSGHYLNLGDNSQVYVLARQRVRIPIWLKQNNWGVDFKYINNSLFDAEIGIENFKNNKFNIEISSRERAILELISILDLSESFDALEEYFNGIMNIRSELTQSLLESCTSIKVKRVFLYLATKLDLPVVKKLNVNKINLGTGKRVIVKNGMLDAQFGITVPRESQESEGP